MAKSPTREAKLVIELYRALKKTENGSKKYSKPTVLKKTGKC